jgi:nicotinamide-nucleotide amidase
MRAELISIGDELLIGQTINTNVAWIGMELSLMGISVKRSVVIHDQEDDIVEALDEAFSRADLIILTGGLGPTKDDITKKVLCSYFNTELEINAKVLERVESFFKALDREMLDTNIAQAALPKSCVVLDNLEGTASGMWFEKEGRVLISLPGVPYEMKAILKNEGFPRIQQVFKFESIYHQSRMLQGIGESTFADKMKDWEQRIYDAGLKLAYLPSVGILKLRITSLRGVADQHLVNSFFKELEDKYPYFVFGSEGETLPSIIGQLLTGFKKTIGTVESCTGGQLAQTIVAVSGASKYYQGSLLTYSNALKIQMIGVSEEKIANFGAVSKEVVEEMALLGRKKLNVDYCLSTSGIAGPDGGTDEKPVGTVWVAIASKDHVFSKKFNFGGHRERNIQMTVLSALNLLRCNLLGYSLEKK